MATQSPTGWLLTLEPVDGAVSWSLLKSRGATVLVDAGHLGDTRNLAELATTLRPTISAAPDQHGRAGLWASPLTRADDEQHASRTLGGALLPTTLRKALLQDSDPARPDTVTVATRGWLAGIPWDILALDPGSGSVDGPRLLERAVVVGGLSPVISATRARSAPDIHCGAPGYAVVDPGPLHGPLGCLYPTGIPAGFTAQLTALGDAHAGQGTSREELAFQLHQNAARLLYVGHIRSAPDGSAAGSLVLRGTTPITPDYLTPRQWLASPDHYPAPPRVAFIGCSSDDTADYEQRGLVVAAVNAGAHVVTSTRWPLPTDNPEPSPCTPERPINHEGLTDLALAVHAAHSDPKPIPRLRRWQLGQLQDWTRTKDPKHSPLLWAGLVSYLAPPTRKQPQ